MVVSMADSGWTASGLCRTLLDQFHAGDHRDAPNVYLSQPLHSALRACGIFKKRRTLNDKIRDGLRRGAIRARL